MRDGEEPGAFLLKWGAAQGCPLSPVLFNVTLEVLANAAREGKEIKDRQIEKEEIKNVFVHRWHGNLCRKSKRIKAKKLEIMSDCGKATGYKVNIQKSIALLYSSSEQGGFEIKKTMPFTLILQKNRYKCNKICTWSIWGKPHKWRDIPHIHGQEGLILSNFQFSPSWSADSMQSQTNF